MLELVKDVVKNDGLLDETSTAIMMALAKCKYNHKEFMLDKEVIVMKSQKYISAIFSSILIVRSAFA